jgi:amino acid transporter
MAEELTFARKASGLVRGLSTYDAFGMGLINILPLYVIWWMVMAGLGFFPRSNLFISLGLTCVTLGVASPIVWGVLGGSMPRSGGDYLYNTRVINPAIGMAASMGMILGQMYWSIYMATWITQPSLQLIGQFLGWQGLVDFASGTWGTFACTLLLFAGAFSLVAFGWKAYKLVIRPVLAITIATTAIVFIPMLFMSKGAFINTWNTAASTYDSLDYSSFIRAVETANGAPLPTTWSWGDTIGAFTATFMVVIYAYVSCYVGGEVKKPGKALFTANWLGGAVAAALSFLCLFGLYHMASSKFLIAAAYNSLYPVEGYALPWDTSVLGLTFMGSGMNRFIGVLIALTWLLGTIAIFAVILGFVQRVLFAWGMDRMGPKFFTAISPRWGSPIKSFAFVAIVICGLSVAYELWLQDALTGLVASGMMTVSVFAVTAISAILLPYRKRVQGVWVASPYSQWKLAGIPVVTIGGLVYFAYVLILLYYAFLSPNTRDVTGKNLFVFVGVWIIGFAWFMFWRYRSMKADINIDLAFKELPPE